MTAKSTRHSNGGRSTGSSADGAESRPKLKFTPPHRSRQEILKIGEDCARLLNSTVFSLVVQSTLEELGSNLLYATLPHEREKREWMYLQSQALGEVLLGLRVMIEEANALTQDELADEFAAQSGRDPDLVGDAMTGLMSGTHRPYGPTA